MTYQVKIETEIGELEPYGEPFTNKAKAISFARRAAKRTLIDCVRLHVDCVETDMAVFTTNRAAR